MDFCINFDLLCFASQYCLSWSWSFWYFTCLTVFLAHLRDQGKMATHLSYFCWSTFLRVNRNQFELSILYGIIKNTFIYGDSPCHLSKVLFRGYWYSDKISCYGHCFLSLVASSSQIQDAENYLPRHCPMSLFEDHPSPLVQSLPRYSVSHQTWALMPDLSTAFPSTLHLTKCPQQQCPALSHVCPGAWTLGVHFQFFGMGQHMFFHSRASCQTWPLPRMLDVWPAPNFLANSA